MGIESGDLQLSRIKRILTKCGLLGVLLLVLDGAATCQTKTVTIAAGQTSDVWLGVDVSGKVYYAIRTRDGKNKARMWWILQPLGRVKQLGTLQGNGSLNIPNKLKGSLSAKLRAKADSDTVIVVGENVAIDQGVTFKWP